MNLLVRKCSLTLVGVGPGDPNLLTIAAIDAIENAHIIAYPVALEGGESLAYQIASKWIKKTQEKLPLIFPMVEEISQREKAWSKAISELEKTIKKERKVVFISQGDVSLYSTASYVLLGVKARYPQITLRVIPGITSFSAAAALGQWPLSFQKDQMLVIPTPQEPESLVHLLEESESIGRVLVLLKLGNRWPWVREILDQKGLLQSSLFAENVGWPDQKVVKASDVSSTQRSYFSLVLIRQVLPNIFPDKML